MSGFSSGGPKPWIHGLRIVILFLMHLWKEETRIPPQTTVFHERVTISPPISSRTTPATKIECRCVKMATRKSTGRRNVGGLWHSVQHTTKRPERQLAPAPGRCGEVLDTDGNNRQAEDIFMVAKACSFAPAPRFFHYSIRRSSSASNACRSRSDPFASRYST